MRLFAAAVKLASPDAAKLMSGFPGSVALQEQYIAGLARAMEAVYKAKWLAAHSAGEPAWLAFKKRLKPGLFRKAAEICAEEHARRPMSPERFIDALSEGNKKFKIIPVQFLASDFAAQYITNWIPPDERVDPSSLDERGNLIPTLRSTLEELRLDYAEQEWQLYHGHGGCDRDDPVDHFPGMSRDELPRMRWEWKPLGLSPSKEQAKWDGFMAMIKGILEKHGSPLLGLSIH